MKATFTGLLYLTLLLMATHFISFVPPKAYTAAEALRNVRAEFQTALTELDQTAAAYEATANAFVRGEASAEALQKVHSQTRLAYKSLEFLLEYNDREAVKKYLNGPPLLSVEPKVPEVRIIEPVGLQVLDELVYGEDPKAEQEEILRLVRQFNKDFSKVKAFQEGLVLQHRFVFEAFRYQLVRIFTLGLTGFDTPGSGAALPEARQSLEGAAKALMAYFPLLEQIDAQLATDCRMELGSAIAALSQPADFNDFRRLQFLKKHLNPLLKLSLEAQKALEVELLNEITDRPQAWNYEADNLFSDEFLNPSYYTNLSDAAQSEERIALGRMLFYDPILSANNERSCASCHHPDKAFTDGLPRSMALNGEGNIQRNAPTLINSVYAEHYFYDLREPNLERQVKHVVRDEKEFNTDFLEIVDKLKQSGAYRSLFASAYPEHPQYQISKWSISNALACYVADLRSFNSPFDQYVRGEREAIAAEVERGFDLFMGKANCGTCHFAPVFNGTVPPYFQESESEVLGVPAAAHGPDSLTLDPDPGRFASYKPIDQTPFYLHSFKTVTVRNAALTAPYMHNGIYQSLEEVVDFYNKGGGAGMGIAVPYQTLPDTPLELSEQEVQDLVAFMEALTDTTGMTAVPDSLPVFQHQPEWNKREVGGSY